MRIIRFIRRLLLAAEEAVNASVDRALGEEVPINDLLDSCPTCDAEEQVGDDTLAMVHGTDTISDWAHQLAAEQETAELEDLLKLPAFERGQA